MIHWTWLFLAFFGGWVILSLMVAGRLADTELDAVRERERAETLSKGIRAVNGLIADSRGVAGLHLNGDEAPWDELLAGGKFEDWLKDFSAAALLSQAQASKENPA